MNNIEPVEQISLFDQTELKLREARRLRDRGIKRAADHAGENWNERAFALFIAYIEQHPGDTFMTEDVREWATPRIELPPDNRAWGQIALRALRAGRIAKYGFAPHRNPKQHMSPGNVWRITP